MYCLLWVPPFILWNIWEYLSSSWKQGQKLEHTTANASTLVNILLKFYRNCFSLSQKLCERAFYKMCTVYIEEFSSDRWCSAMHPKLIYDPKSTKEIHTNPSKHNWYIPCYYIKSLTYISWLEVHDPVYWFLNTVLQIH